MTWVLAIGGLMGSGKSTLAAALSERVRAAVVRSDVVRKALFEVGPEVRLPEIAYGAAANRRTNLALLESIRSAATSGRPVIADATFLDPALRVAVGATATAMGWPFRGVWLDVPLDELERRVAARQAAGMDASDATVAVLRAAVIGRVAPTEWVRIDARDAEAALTEVQALVAML